jgi:CRP-like cAMP-binding protein
MAGRPEGQREKWLCLSYPPTTALALEHLKTEVLPAGHVVFEDHAPGDTLYILQQGRVQANYVRALFTSVGNEADRVGPP